MVKPGPVNTVLCLASYEKGAEFLREAKRLGCYVSLVTVTALQDAAWPRESIDELYVMPDLSRLDDVCNGVSYLARSHEIDRIIALDDYDVPTAAALREHLRLPGLSLSQARYFRDKLAMRTRTRVGGILVPDFVHILNYDRIRRFTERVSAPWVLKPRMEVSTIGISTIENEGELWERIESLGDRQSNYLLERYVPGSVYHVDSIVSGGTCVFSEAHSYARPPLNVFHEGGIAMSRTILRNSEDAKRLQELNAHVLDVLGMDRGVTHLEFIKGVEDGRFYFLEVGARVGGAYTAEMVEAASGINLWREWARLEVLGDNYALPERRADYGAVLLSLAHEEHPDTSSFGDNEIIYRVHKRHHIGFVLVSNDAERLSSLQDEYAQRIARDFAATLPPWEERPPSR